MSKLYGTLEGARGPVTRQGHTNLRATAQSWNGSVTVEMYFQNGAEWVGISAGPGSTTATRDILYNGPLSELMDAVALIAVKSEDARIAANRAAEEADETLAEFLEKQDEMEAEAVEGAEAGENAPLSGGNIILEPVDAGPCPQSFTRHYAGVECPFCGRWWE